MTKEPKDYGFCDPEIDEVDRRCPNKSGFRCSQEGFLCIFCPDNAIPIGLVNFQIQDEAFIKTGEVFTRVYRRIH